MDMQPDDEIKYLTELLERIEKGTATSRDATYIAMFIAGMFYTFCGNTAAVAGGDRIYEWISKSKTRDDYVQQITEETILKLTNNQTAH